MTTEQQQLPMADDLSFGRLIGTSISARLLIDTGVQIFNPYLPIIAAGLNSNIVVLGRLLGLRSAMGLLAPAFGELADRRSYRMVLRLGLLLSALGMLVVGLSTGIWMATAGMILSGLGLSSFVPTLQAYLSARLPYARRARGMGMVEYSWALTGIVGLSAMGWVIQATNWRMPFFILAAGLGIMFLVFGTLPAARTARPPAAGLRQGPRRLITGRQVRTFFDLGPNARSAYGAIVVATFNFFAAMQLMITYGAWLSNEYALTAVQLGLVAMLFGFFDLIASVSVSLFTDGIGKRRSVLIGTVGSLAGYMAMPFLNVGTVVAILGMAVTRGFFEFAVVSNFPLLSEQAPDRRGKVMTLNAAISLMGATIAGFSGPWLYARYGAWGLAGVSALAAMVSLVTLLTVVREGGE